MFLMIFRKRQILSRFVNFCQLYFLATLGYSSSSNSSIWIRTVVVNWIMFFTNLPRNNGFDTNSFLI